MKVRHRVDVCGILITFILLISLFIQIVDYLIYLDMYPFYSISLFLNPFFGAFDKTRGLWTHPAPFLSRLPVALSEFYERRAFFTRKVVCRKWLTWVELASCCEQKVERWRGGARARGRRRFSFGRAVFVWWGENDRAWSRLRKWQWSHHGACRLQQPVSPLPGPRCRRSECSRFRGNNLCSCLRSSTRLCRTRSFPRPLS